MLAKGAAVGNYIVESHIGGGGMAQLYRVRHAVLGTVHALKVLNSEFREMAEVRSRFLTEGMIAAKLKHANVVKVTDTVSTLEVAGLVMELILGPNLEQYIRKRKTPPTPEQIRDIFLPVLAALGEAHRCGIIHRDIKPANILLEDGGGQWIPKLTDFGIAKVLKDNPDLVRRKSATQAEARMGTLSYMSPEQIRGATAVTAQSDIFALGATLYELATCEVAFDGPSDYDVMHRIVHGQHTRPDLIERLDPVIAAAILRALEPLPEQRFATCEEFAAALSQQSLTLSAASGLRPGSELDLSSESGDMPTKHCPFCNEVILASARKCKHCLEFLDPALKASRVTPAESAPPSLIQSITENKSLLPWNGGRQAVLSLFIPGLGQFISNRPGSALFFFTATALWYLLIHPPSAVLLHILAAIHAYAKPPKDSILYDV